MTTRQRAIQALIKSYGSDDTVTYIDGIWYRNDVQVSEKLQSIYDSICYNAEMLVKPVA